MKVLAPGKLILSGEHAVVHGNPAIAMAVNRYARAIITQESSPDVFVHLANLAHRSRLTFGNLQHLKERIKRKYHRFIRGEYRIRDVLHKPFELAQVALGLFLDAMNVSLPPGMHIHVESDIPMGCGMGSSAATILAVMQAMSNHLNLAISADTLFRLALEAENLQHGHSSGLDLRVAQQGGCLYVHGGVVQVREVPTQPFYLINTGRPRSTTGECVEQVAPYFKSISLNQAFAETTNAMDNAFATKSSSALHDAIKENHALLSHIGVVPMKVKQFITHVEAVGGAAKICGAGAVSGDAAGAVLVLADDESALHSLASQYAYNVIPIHGEARGVYAV